MADEIKLSEQFVATQIETLCETRQGARASPLPPCKDCNPPWRPAQTPQRREWGQWGKRLGSCFVGIDWESDWIDTHIKKALNRCLGACANIDWLLHLSQKRYRDHSSHQLFVGILGSFLLGCQIGAGRQTLREWVATPLGLTQEEVDIAWWLASLLHDHAYPLSHMLQVTPCVVEENRELLLDETWALLGFQEKSKGPHALSPVFGGLYDCELLKDLRQAVGDADGDRRRTRLQKIIMDRLVAGPFKENELCGIPGACYDHGLLAAANLSVLLPVRQGLPIMKAVIRAIGIHNGGACAEGVDANKDPLAFLLILCDECQEWDRRFVKGDEVLFESRGIRLRELQTTKTGKYTLGDCMSIVFEYPDAARLEDTGWDYRLFRSCKERAFSRLRVSGDFPIRRIEFDVRIPHEIQIPSL